MKIKSIFGLCIAGIVGLSVSCKELDETYDEFTKGGEIVYRAKPAYVEAHPGNQRARIEWSLLFPTLVEKCLIYSDGQLLTEVPVTYADSVRLSCMLENLEEKTYILNIYSEDAQGNRSIKVEQFVNIYGPRYISTLRTNREIKDAFWDESESGTVKVILSDKAFETLSTEIVYQNTAGQSQTVKVDPDTREVILTKVPASGTIQIQDLSQPDTACIDTFTAPAITYDLAGLPSQSSRTATAYKNSYASSQVKLTLSRAKSNVVKTVICYPEIGGAVKTVEMQPSESVLMLENVAESGHIELTTYFRDNEDAPVYFATPVKLDLAALPTKFKPFWKRVEVSDYQINEGSPDNIFDDDLGTYWHTPYNNNKYVHPDKNGDVGYPHWITIDMGGSMTIRSFEVARRQNNAHFAKRIRFEVSEDGENWQGEEFDADNNHEGMQSFTLNTPLTGRYFRFTGLVSGTTQPYMCMSEISVY